MNKTARLSALAVVLAASVGTTAFAATSTVTGGYAQSNMQGKANKVGGFNLKYRYEQDNNPLSVIGSFTYTERDNTSDGTYNKGQYYGIIAGPVYRLNDRVSIYGVMGVGYDKLQNNNFPDQKSDMSDYGFSYGAGPQLNLTENVALDSSYEQSRIRNVDVGTWIAGAGYRS